MARPQQQPDLIEVIIAAAIVLAVVWTIIAAIWGAT